MQKLKVSGVPYMVDMYPNFDTISDAVDFYENIISELDRENKQMRARMDRLEEEVEWLESLTRKFKDDLK